MLLFILRRLFAAIPVLAAGSALAYGLVGLAGSPLDALLERNPPPPPQTVELLRQRLSLDEPIWQRYAEWLWGVVSRGDFGPSVREGYDIGANLLERGLVTLRLVIVAMVVALFFAVLTGVLSAVRQYSRFDYTVTFTGFVFLAMPSFWLALVLKDLAVRYNQATGSTIFYTIGEASPDTIGFTAWQKAVDIAGHLALPTIALALVSYAAWSRYQRTSMLDVLNSDYVRLARAKGLRWRTVLTRHALRTALIPLTTVTALDIAAILGGAVVTETVFNWNGMGRMLVEAVARRDTNVVASWLLLAGFFVVLLNIIADVLYALLDPRIRHA